MTQILALESAIPDVDPRLLWIAGGCLAILLTGVAVWILLGLRRSRAVAVEDRSPSINVASLTPVGPEPTGPQLTCYGVPIRLTVLVLAAAGRDGSRLEGQEVSHLLDALVPSLGSVILHRDRPRLDRWPPQLSSHGFMRSLFANAALPGQEGKGTPWIAVAGRAEHRGTAYLVGIIAAARDPNNLGAVTIEHPGQWLDILRIRDEPSAGG